MKYQYILNNELLFETNDASEFYSYLINLEDYKQAFNSTMFNLLVKSKGYICNMADASGN